MGQILTLCDECYKLMRNANDDNLYLKTVMSGKNLRDQDDQVDALL